MCRIYNMIGSLAIIKSELERNSIYDFNSLKDILDFKSSFTKVKGEVISHHEKLIEQEKEQLTIELKQLEEAIELQRESTRQLLIDKIDSLKQRLNFYSNNRQRNLLKRIVWGIREYLVRRRVEIKERKFEFDVERSVETLLEEFHDKNQRYEFIVSQFHQAVEQSSFEDLSKLDRKKVIIDELESFIYGAIGEQKVVKVLEELSDDYCLINDFSVSFYPAIFNRQENDYISSVQIDHILVGPAGIFLIETKNWSKKSIESLSLRSPVKQIKRASFALFVLLNNEKYGIQSDLDRHHWGDKKVSVKNLIVLINSKPKEEFQYVKVLGLNELLSYVSYFKRTYSDAEVNRIAEFLLHVNHKKTILTK